jgi:hypothetical protein
MDKSTFLKPRFLSESEVQSEQQADTQCDIPSDEEVWPVLVFEKAQFGDLYSFATLPVGRDLCIAERLKLCVDVGTAIMDMHFNSRLLMIPKFITDSH